MTFIAVQCPHCHSEQIVKRGKTPGGPSATCARIPRVPREFSARLPQPRLSA